MATAVQPKKQPFIRHVQELRQRLFYWALSLIAGACVGYWLQQPIQAALIHPLNQPLFYTDPVGGFNFLIRICLFFGLLVSIPVFTYNLLKFIQPLLAKSTRFLIVKLLFFSVLLAGIGGTFAYFISLPAALHFLSGFGGGDIKSLISTDEYLRFVMLYIGGYALLFQLPLILFFINWIKPMRPKKLMQKQRWVILISFIVAAVLTPTPDPINQTIMAVPMILLYQVSIIVIWLTNRRRRFNLAGEVVKAEVTPETAPRLQQSQLLAHTETHVQHPATLPMTPMPLPRPVAQTVPAAWSGDPAVVMLSEKPTSNSSRTREFPASASTWPSTLSQRTLDLKKQNKQDLYYRPSRNIIDMRPKSATENGI